MTHSKFRNAVLAGSSLSVIAIAVMQPVLAQDSTITSSSAAVDWDATVSPGTNLTITSTGTINSATPYALTIIGTVGSTLGSLTNDGKVIDTAATGKAINIGTVSMAGIYNNLTGTISAAKTAILLGNAGTIGVLSNSGLISGLTAISTPGSIGSLSNTGMISGSSRGLFIGPGGRVDTINNAGTITVAAGAAGAAGGIANSGSILTLINTGTIVSSSSSGLGNNINAASIGQITNSGLISGVTGGLYNQGTMSQITNTGRIIGTQAGIFHTNGTIGTINNSGTISGGSYGISIGAGVFTSLINSGTVSGPIALYLGSGVPALNIANTGVIAGGITNASANALTITGGSGLAFGTLTGSTLTNQGSIVNTLSNLVFASGNLVLNDNINATGRTVSNSGATLKLNSTVNLAGAYSQTAGTLDLSPTAAGLIVSGAADVSGGTVKSSFASTGNYLAGTYTLLSGSTLSLAGATVTINNLTGLYKSVSTISNSLRLTVNNDYVGGTLATLANSAVISGASTGLYVATTGSIGTVSNTGTLGGVQFGINNRGTISTLSNAGLITDNNFTALWNQGSIGQLVNTGTISNNSWAILNTGTIGTLTNSGVIAGAGNAIQNNGVITLLNNSGTMSGASNAVSGTFGTLANSGLIRGDINKFGGLIGTIIGGTGGAIGTFTGFNGTSQGTIGASGNITFASGALLLNDTITAVGIAASALTISNTGADITLSTIVNINGNFSQSAGTLNLGSAGKLVVSQAASITGGTIAVGGLSATSNYIAGSVVGTLVAGGTGSSYVGASISLPGVSGLIASAVTSGNNLVLGIGNDYIGGTLASIGNTGSIGGVANALYVASTGSLGSLTNSGTLSGSIAAIYNAGMLGPITNTGVIAGNIENVAAQALTFTGGTGTSVGTLTGLGGGRGTITNTAGDVVFASGNLLLNDDVVATGHVVSNSGAVLSLTNSANITGDYSQTAGTLVLATGQQLNVSGAASLTGGTVSTNLPVVANYLAGSTAATLVTGGTGSSYAGVSVTAGPITGLALSAGASGNNLIVTANNNYIGANLGSLSNTGTLNADYALYVASTGSLGSLTNSGTLSGSIAAIYNAGTLGPITNTGVIAGNIENAHAQDLVFIGGTGGTFGTLTGYVSGSQGTITNTLGNVVLASGSILLNDAVNVGTGSLVNAGATVQLNSIVVVTGNYTQASGTLALGLSSLQVSGVANISGGMITTNQFDGTANYLVGSSGGTLVHGGAGSSYDGVSIASGVTGLEIATSIGTIGSNVDLLLTARNDYIGGTLASLTNTGTISGVTTAAFVASTGSIGTLSNSGVLGGSLYGVNNRGTIGTILNAGSLIDAPAVLAAGLNNSGAIGVVVNQGTISGAARGLYNGGRLDSLTNGGTISGGAYGMLNAGTLGPISNSGLIQGATAISNEVSGLLGPITNTGVIAGNIENVAAQALTFTGGTGASVGTLTGLGGGRGTITNTAGDVVFASGNLLLNDDVVATGHVVSNSGAVLSLTNSANITGDYSQTAGTLVLATGQQLNVSGAASLTGGTVSTNLPVVANYLAGSTAATLVTGGTGSSYAGVSVTAGPITGLALSAGASGNNLIVTANNNYIGANLGSLSNTGTLNADYALYVASTGSLGSLTNSGTLSGSIAAIYNAGTLGPITNTGVIAGNIENRSTADLRIAGGAGTGFGVLTGYAAGSQGTITNVSSNVVLSGNILLNNAVNLGTHSLVADGASLQVNSPVAVTGNYTQTGGTLLIGITSTAAYGQLAVSGSAALSGTNVKLVALGGSPVAAGTAYTVVKANGTLTYSNLTASVAGSEGSFSTISSNGTNGLVLSVGDNSQPTRFTPTGIEAGGAGVGTGAALDAIVDGADGNSAALPVITDVLLPLAVLPEPEQQRAILQLSPAQLTPQVIAVAVSPAVNAIFQHQEVLAANVSAGEERGMSAGSQGLHGAVWGQLLFNTAKRDAEAGASPYAAHSFGVMAGVDLLGAPNFVAGGALSWVNSAANGRGALMGSRTRLDSFQTTGYFTWQPGIPEATGLNIDGQLGFGYNVYKQQRRIDFLGTTATASFDGQQYLGSLRASYTLPLSETASVTPFAGVREVHLHNPAYTESGAGAANLQVGEMDVDSFSHEIGFKGEAVIDTAVGRFTPSLKLGWTHSYVNGPIPLTAVLGGVTFTSTSARLARDGALVGAGLSFMRTDWMRIGAEYDGEFRSAFQSHTGTVKLTVNF